jgi:hypothetical protein
MEQDRDMSGTTTGCWHGTLFRRRLLLVSVFAFGGFVWLDLATDIHGPKMVRHNRSFLMREMDFSLMK